MWVMADQPSKPSSELPAAAEAIVPVQNGPRKGQKGLHIVFDPPEGTAPTYPVDIIFVHGLNGDIRATWTHDNGVFWPKDLLPASMPGARILSYGYDSKIFFSADTAEYRDFALHLVGSLRDLQDITVSSQHTSSHKAYSYPYRARYSL